MIEKFNPQSLNRYAYTRNDPINLVDPLGLLIRCGVNLSFLGTFFPIDRPSVDLFTARIFCFNAVDISGFLDEFTARVDARRNPKKDKVEALQRILMADCIKFIEETFFRAQTGFSSGSRPGAAQRLADSLRAAKIVDQTDRFSPLGRSIAGQVKGNVITLFKPFNSLDGPAGLVREAFHLASVPDLGDPFNDFQLARAVGNPVEGTTLEARSKASENFLAAVEAACGPNKP